MIARGSGLPLVFIPGIQGRWEIMAPAIDALAARGHRVLTFSLDECVGPACFAAWTDLIRRALDADGHESAAILGVSFGALVALRFAADHAARTRRLVLVSPPRPRGPWEPHVARYLRRPRLSMPMFAFRAIGRLGPEIAAARPTWRGRVAFGAGYAVRLARWPIAPRAMATWVRAWPAAGIEDACRAIQAPALVITGEPRFDRVVPVADSRAYVSRLAHASHATLDGTGHLGLLLKPAEFARLVSDFTADALPASGP